MNDMLNIVRNKELLGKTKATYLYEVFNVIIMRLTESVLWGQTSKIWCSTSKIWGRIVQ